MAVSPSLFYLRLFLCLSVSFSLSHFLELKYIQLIFLYFFLFHLYFFVSGFLRRLRLPPGVRLLHVRPRFHLLSPLCSLLHQGLPHSQDQVEGKILFDSVIPGKGRDLTRFEGIRDTDESNYGNRYSHLFLLLVYINTNTKWKVTFNLRCLSIQFRETERFWQDLRLSLLSTTKCLILLRALVVNQVQCILWPLSTNYIK